MKALVVGAGSIGFRHYSNLRKLCIHSLAVVEPDFEQRGKKNFKEDVLFFDDIEKGLDWGPDFVVIATPTHLHIEHALKVARGNCHFFIEKPLSHVEEGLDELLREVKSRGLISLVGCNMRFHPGPRKVKKLIEENIIGRKIFADIYTGSYLPEWRPSQDYRKSYSSNRSMGGGCILDCIHEIDLARWYLGDAKEVFCVAEHLSSLEVDVEDVAILVIRHLNSIISEIHLDFIQRTYERGCKIVGEKGSIFWNFSDGHVRLFDASLNSWSSFPLQRDWDMNQMYLDEMDHFLSCVKRGEKTVNPVSEAIEVTRIALAAKRSAVARSFVSLNNRCK